MIMFIYFYVGLYSWDYHRTKKIRDVQVWNMNSKNGGVEVPELHGFGWTWRCYGFLHFPDTVFVIHNDVRSDTLW